MNPLFGAALDVERFCVGQGWEFCFVGALAVIRLGEPRLTRDVDLTILTGFGGEERYIDALLQRFAPRREDARQFAVRYRVVLLAANAVPVGVALGAMPFEERAVGRSTPWTLADGASIRTSSAEDLVVFKTFAGRLLPAASRSTPHRVPETDERVRFVAGPPTRQPRWGAFPGRGA